jgi:formylglycine-generating enzyme required for sulfatase activity
MVARVVMAAIAVALAGLVLLRDAAGQAPRPATQSSSSPATQSQPAREMKLDLGHGVTLKLAFVPAGKFMMGSPPTERDRNENEGPQREVTISKPFYMGVYEVTREQFGAFIYDSGYKTDAEKKGASWRKPGFDQEEDHPVVLVSHNDVVEFCKWLSKKTGSTVLLPTEAQWEYACRAGSKTAYPWGGDPDGGKGWCNAGDQSAKTEDFSPNDWFSWDDGYVYTSAVGKFKANAFGLHDMIGNVAEWCSDWYNRDYYELKGNDRDPTGLASGSNYVVRGAAWDVGKSVCRSAHRDYRGPAGRDWDIGFRITVSAP